MEITVKNKYVRISSRKVRPVLHGLRGMSGEEALVATKFLNKKAAYFIHSLIKSGVAAAKENYLEPNQVFIKQIACNEGPSLKRFIPWSKGVARKIQKRMSHFELTLESAETDVVKPKKDTKATKSNEVNE